MSNKKRWRVLARRVVNIEDAPSVSYEWIPIGETVAVSESKAINNVRYRTGQSSQHLPIHTGGHYETWIEWAAVEVEG